MKYSKYKNEISLSFFSDDENSLQKVLVLINNTLNDSELDIKTVEIKGNMSNNDYYGKGKEILNELGIKVNDISSIEDINNAKNLNATLKPTNKSPKF